MRFGFAAAGCRFVEGMTMEQVRPRRQSHAAARPISNTRIGGASVPLTFFDGNESTWQDDATFQESWQLNDPSMPDWLKQHL